MAKVSYYADDKNIFICFVCGESHSKGGYWEGDAGRISICPNCIDTAAERFGKIIGDTLCDDDTNRFWKDSKQFPNSVEAKFSRLFSKGFTGTLAHQMKLAMHKK